MRIPDGTATVCVEVLYLAKAGHWVSPEKAIENRRSASQENCSNEVKTQGSASTDSVVFCCGKTAAAALDRVAAAFCYDRRRAPPCTIAPAVIARKPTEYCLSIPFGDPVGNRNNRPLLCLALAISQRASGIHWVYHALTGECSLIHPYLRMNGLCSFCVMTTIK